MDCSFFLQLLQTNVAHGACTTPGGESGHCRHLRFCVLDVFTASYMHFLPYFCRINRSVRHYCRQRCSIGKVLCVITRTWEIVRTSDVADSLHCSITACQVDPSDTLPHTSQTGKSLKIPSRQNSECCIRSHSGTTISTWSLPSATSHMWLRRPILYSTVLLLAAKWSLRVSSPDRQRCWTETGASVRTV
jgi:hypothetical protein